MSKIINANQGLKLINSLGSNSKDYTLLQNAPNPFTDYTEIQFVLNRSGQTVLKVYNLIGKEIATLVEENLNAGAYKVNFHPINLPRGIYIYRLESNGFNEARKMILK